MCGLGLAKQGVAEAVTAAQRQVTGSAAKLRSNEGEQEASDGNQTRKFEDLFGSPRYRGIDQHREVCARRDRS